MNEAIIQQTCNQTTHAQNRSERGKTGEKANSVVRSSVDDRRIRNVKLFYQLPPYALADASTWTK